MLVVVDNGKGANNVANLVRTSKRIVTPKEINSVNADAYILSDGEMKNEKANISMLKS